MGISKTGNHKGFSLIELLIALTLLAVGMMAVASMQTVAIGSNDIANKNSELAALAQQVMEDVLSRASDNSLFTLGFNGPYDLNGPAVAGSSLTLTSAGTYDATLIVTPNTPKPSISRVNVTVQLTQKGTVKTFTLSGFKRVGL